MSNTDLEASIYNLSWLVMHILDLSWNHNSPFVYSPTVMCGKYPKYKYHGDYEVIDHCNLNEEYLHIFHVWATFSYPISEDTQQAIAKQRAEYDIASRSNLIVFLIISSHAWVLNPQCLNHLYNHCVTAILNSTRIDVATQAREPPANGKQPLKGWAPPITLNYIYIYLYWLPNHRC